MVSMGRGIISLPCDNVKKRTTGLFHFVALAFLLAGCEQPNQGDAPEFPGHRVFLNGGVCTINGAHIHDQNDLLGSIEVGKKADLIVLDRNLFEVLAQQINEAKVLMTLFDGEVVFQQPSDT
jgi:hypothetical protein